MLESDGRHLMLSLPASEDTQFGRSVGTLHHTMQVSRRVTSAACTLQQQGSSSTATRPQLALVRSTKWPALSQPPMRGSSGRKR